MRKIIVTKITFAESVGKVTAEILTSSFLLLTALSIILSGCEGAKPKQRPDSNPTEQKQVTPDPKTTENNTENKKPEEKNIEPKKTETVVKAEVGAGAKGHYGGEKSVMAPILVPLGTYWRASEMTTYNMQIPKTMQLYKAEHENKAPATHEEFMEEIIKKGMIKLPTLPPNHKYIYDPKDEQLKIAKPAQ
ncbi:MAG: hypothetical protein LBB88_12145 [Planctomycetaceae bacterium]|jgi:hypothetical protein|nr:hypothetical protein [Planctomycetaceae bacterium]